MAKTKKQEFINYVESNVNFDNAPENVKVYWEALSLAKDDEKPTFTDNGKIVLKHLQETANTHPMRKAKDIADELMVSSRTVSGTLRKLVNDGYVEKIGESPVIYSITEKGKNTIIE